MSNDGDKAAVFKTTKVRTKLRGDNSWLQRHSDTQPETQEDKPWIAEVRASRLNGANVESSPVSSPIQSSPSPRPTSTERSPTSGFLIRGVFTKTEKPPTASNGYSGTTQFTKKTSETYKKIAPYTVKKTAENQEGQLSTEELEKRTEAASSVLNKSAARQRSYVLSAAKIYESKDKTPDLLVNSTSSFVAQRVDIIDDEESNASPSTTTSVTPLPKAQTLVNTSSTKIEITEEIKTEEVKVEEKAPEKDPFENMVPGCTKVATPLPELIPDLVQATYVKADDSGEVKQPVSLVVEPAPPSPPATPPPHTVTVDSIVVTTEEIVKTEPEKKGLQISVEPKSTPTVSNVEPLTDDLLGLNDSTELVSLVPPSSGPWSQDLLSPVESLRTQPVEETQPVTKSQSVTETVTITTKTVIITDEGEEERADPLSSHVITTVTESSSTDPFDPYPIGTTSSNSSSDLLQPLADVSINSASDTSVKTKQPTAETNMSGNVLDSLSDDVIPFNTEATSSLSTHRSWARTWEPEEPESTEESQEAAEAEEGQDGDQQTVIMFERKSSENDSPWDKWTSPTVYSISNEEEDEEEDYAIDTETQIITTVTTIRETHSEPEPSMDRTLIEPEAEIKKPFVYVKEYVNTSELSLLNARDTDRSDYLTSTSTSYSYSSPTYLSGSLSSKCTFCGEQVGNDSKITIDHLNINCHPECFKCGMCSKPMGDLLHKMFLHGGKVHCEICYRNALD
ncbi:zinc finger protein 185 isoform X2 [Boleophthalmus pectinirostris]|uniref:zinc finger protein 185 isoform X2 n=1 Tax=Boleophthalmus pectinirostris TaxID=150288 RepID=UPI000A1C4088|nr:zinc finger protein 185 isoform X2 [Boleophthalmus pectinirostris]